MIFRRGKRRESVLPFVYVAVFAMSAVFLVTTIATVVEIQTRQTSSDNLNRQIVSVVKVMERLVGQSSLIDMTSGSATSTLKLRMASSTMDPTLVYASGTAVYLSEGAGTPSSTPLTDSKISVNKFLVTKYGGPSVSPFVQLDIAASYNPPATSIQRSCFANVSIARVSISPAATSSNAASLESAFTLGGIPAPWYSKLIFETQGWETK